MEHDAPLISTIVAGIVLAFILGATANRFKLPPLVGYLIAGVVVGPYTPGFVADQSLGAQLAEIGVILLMFGVGLHFSPKDLVSVRAFAIPGAILQIVIATALGALLGLAMGWSIPASIYFGFALSIASTVVLLKALQDRRLIETERGRITVGWAIVEDLVTVFALVLIPALVVASRAGTGAEGEIAASSAAGGFIGAIAFTSLKVAGFAGLMLIIGRRVIPWVLHEIAHTGSRELFRLAVLAIALGAALGSAMLFGVSLALGAFFAGMILAESELSQRAAEETLPLRDAFAVLFFVSVGMLFDPAIILRDPLPVLAAAFIIIVARAAIVVGLARLFGQSSSTGFTIAASRAQIGEFSFILASLGIAQGLLPVKGQDLIVAGALISIILNPATFWAFAKVERFLEARRERKSKAATTPEAAAPEAAPAEARTEPAPEEDAPPPPTDKTNHTILVGYGRVGKTVAEGLAERRASFVVIEDAEPRVAEARASGCEVVFGNAASADVLRLANIGGARRLMVAIPNVFDAGAAVEQGRKLNPSLEIIARAHSENEEAHLRNLGASAIVLGGREIGRGLLERAGEIEPATPPEPAPPVGLVSEPVLEPEPEPAPPASA
ncbi:MAG: YbaL family putative K(+) efflux transporter [Parvularculaceae bacterium]